MAQHRPVNPGSGFAQYDVNAGAINAVTLHDTGTTPTTATTNHPWVDVPRPYRCVIRLEVTDISAGSATTFFIVGVEGTSKAGATATRDTHYGSFGTVFYATATPVGTVRYFPMEFLLPRARLTVTKVGTGTNLEMEYKAEIFNENWAASRTRTS